MAKKASKKRRRVGAVSLNPNSLVVKLAATGLGYLMADKVNGAIDKWNIKPATATEPAGVKLNENIVMAGEGGLGAALLLTRSKANAIGYVKVAAGGIAAGAAIKRVFKKFGVIKGYQAVPVIGRHRMAGYQQTPVIGGTPAQMQGVPPQLAGYRVNGYVPHGSGVLGSVNLGADSSAYGSGYMR